MRKATRDLLEGRSALAENEVKDLLREYHIPTTNYKIVSGHGGIAGIGLNYPLVMKVCSEKILHKTDVGGVVLGIRDETELATRIAEFNAKFPGENILVEEMMPRGTELIMGLIRDPTFGLSIMVGVGGIFTELYKDVTFRMVPITRQDAVEMLEELKGRKLLEGFRNIKTDREAVIDLLFQISKMGEEMGDKLASMDLNPVFVYEKGLSVVDAKLLLNGGA
ncbi:MAG: acetyl-CoA synthetase [Thermoplasmata archaeon HGW-Thermoplasmata-1]|nr:MAG: acetyl-CoA synthetase [Thermoplasmata archaeon HGW-Thermoplasmata-1]